jgi:anti-sigma regulatory factor (Ser/Thr protein kinase)
MLRLHTTGPALALGRTGVARPPAPGRGRSAFPGKEFRELWLRPDASELRRARWLAETTAGEHGLAEDESFRLTFAVNEAVANAIEHGAASPDGYILVRVSCERDLLSFEVHDWGCFAPELGGAEALPERGRGLALMASMVDEVDVRPGADATVVRLSMRIDSRT